MPALYKGDGTTIDATGTGTVEFTVPSDVRWTITAQSGRIEVTTTRPDLNIYVNGQWREGSYQGQRSNSDSEIALEPGDTITCEWTGATAGVRATYRIWGQQNAVG